MKRIIKKFLTLLLAVAIALIGIPTDGIVFVNAAEHGKIVYYDFKNYDSTIINDASGNGKAAVMRNYDKGGYSIVDANIYGTPVKALSLPGGVDGGYLELPINILAGQNNVTINMWVKLSTATAYQRIWDFGNDTTKYMYLLSHGNNTGFKGYASAITTNGWGSEQGIQKTTNISLNKWVLTTVVIADKKMSLYENGALVGTKDLTIGISDLGNTTKNYIGYGQFGDAPTKGQFAEVSIYNYAMSDAEVASLYNVNDNGIVAGDIASINLGNLTAVTKNITLPTIGENGSTISWASDNSAIQINGATGIVTRPAVGSADAAVTLTATVTYNGITQTKDFPATVLASYSDDTIAKHDVDSIIIANLDAVQGKLTLPVTGEWGSTISWASSNPSIITTTGAVNRPDSGQPVTVTLTATVTYGSSTQTKDFTATVLVKQESKTITSYEPIAVTTTIGNSPSLPNFVKVTYSDGSTAKVRTIWPVTIPASQYTKLGGFEVAGKIIGETTNIIAAVTVVADAKAAAELEASQFDLSDISLDGDSILTQNRARTIAYLKLLDNNRMLYNFNKTFGNYRSIGTDGVMTLKDGTTKVSPLGGWDEPTGLLRGHSTGHYLSALSLAYASTKDEAIKAKLDDMVHQLRELQKLSKGDPAAFVTRGTNQAVWSTDPNVWGDGFLSAYSPDQFALLEVYTPYATIWAPYYTLHKIMAGLLAAYDYTGNTEALDAAKDLGEWVYHRLRVLPQAQLSKMWDMYIAGEFGGFNESLSRLYIITGNTDYLNAAKLFDNKKFFDNLTKNVDDIANRHANQHLPQIVGAMELYAATVQEGHPESYYFNIGKNFWDMVVSRYAYSIGGVGTGEIFKTPYAQAAFISGTTNCETCAAYNMLKLTKMVYQYDPDNADYMDYYERTLENQIIGSQNPNVTSSMHNGTTYMLPIGPGVTKSYSGDYNSFTCCHGTGMENHVKYQEATYFKKDNTLYVNLYLPTTLNWAEKGLKVTQETQFPSENTQLTVSELGESSSSIDMKFRVPYWATEGFTVKLNGEVKVANPEPSTYVELKGIKSGDVITINMPFTYHLDKTPDKLGSSEVASVMYGPFVMVGKDTSTTMKTLAFSENLSDSIRKDTTSTTVPKLTTNGISFAPIYDASNYAYSAYFKVITGDPDAKYYEVTTTNSTPSNGSISVSTDLAKEGSNVVITCSPKADYKVKSLLVNGTAVTIAADNTYTVVNVTAKLVITVTFSLINPPTPDPKALDQTATPSAHYTASWEKLSGINNAAFNPTVSNGGTGKGWGNWSQPTGSTAWVAYTWDTDVTMDTFEIFWYDDGGGTRVPSAISFSYMDSNGSWQPVTMISQYADIVALNKYNIIRIQPVTTSSIRINMTVRSNACGIYRWKVYNSTYVAVTGVTLDKNTLDLAAGGASEQLIAEVAPENATNKNVTWSTNNPSVATVVNGVVTPLAPGTAIITVTTNYGAKKATCTVHVEDKTAPVLNLPSNITAEATGADGAIIDFNVTAHDAVDGDVTVTCTPASGSTFAIGTTEVECVATDIAGNAATGTFTVTVQDATAPVLVLPENIITKATGPDGAAVNFTATANDLVDGEVPVEFTTKSGSIFAPGETIVYCTAKDSSGNEATGSFTVTVKYDFKGFFSPIRMNTINEVNAGSSVPIKFSLGGNMGLNIFEAGSPKVDEDLTVTAGNSTLTYDSTTDQYTYVWKTDKAWAGATKILRARFNDGTEQEVVFKFK